MVFKDIGMNEKYRCFGKSWLKPNDYVCMIIFLESTTFEVGLIGPDMCQAYKKRIYTRRDGRDIFFSRILS